jgi:hypothetical protein
MIHSLIAAAGCYRFYASFARRNSFYRLTAKTLRRQESQNTFLADLRVFAVAFSAALPDFSKKSPEGLFNPSGLKLIR